jgi:hemolysin activation/secretion protein
MTKEIWAAVLLTLLVPAASHAANPPEAQQVSISDISIIGNTLLPQAVVDAVVAPYKGQRTMDEIRRAAQALQDAYRQAGYGAVVTFLPEQAVSGGKLVIGVLEGRVARVTVLGNKQFDTANIRRAVPALAEGRTPQVRRIDAQVQLANDNPSRKLAVTLEAGLQRGDVDATVQVSEEPVARWLLAADNTGSPQTGRLRLGLAYQHAALWGLDHQVSLQAQVAPEHLGAVRVFSGSYRVPVYSAGLLLSAYGTYSNVDAGTTATAAGALQFNGKGRALGLSVTRLLERLGEFDQRVSASLEARDYLNDCAILGLPAGACGVAGESVTVHPLTVEYTAQRGGDRPAGVNLSLSHNIDMGGGRSGNIAAVRPGGAQSYTLLRGGANAGMALGRDWRAAVRLTAQATSDALIPGEQFGATGAGLVRGYEEREVTGDSGVVGSFELLSPELGTAGLRGVVFADAGTVRNQQGTLCNVTRSNCSVSALGLGARFSLGPMQWKIDLAQALQDGRSTQRHSSRVHFVASVPFQ